MHYIDLLNYLIDVQKIEKDELCELIAIPKKKVDSVLAGATPLKKKCLKNLSLYTNIPLDAIKSGNFVLNIPQNEFAEGEEAPKIIKDAYVPEYIREANTNRLKAYCKKRYKNRRDDVISLLIVQILLSVIGVAISLFLAYAIRTVGYKSSLTVFSAGIIPAVLGLIIGVNSYKFAWKGTAKSEKHFTFYTILYIIQVLLYTIVHVATKWTSPLAFVFAILAVLPVIYTVFFEKNDKLKYVKSLILGVFSAFSVGSIFILTAASDYLNNVEDERILVLAGILSFFGFLILSVSASNLIVDFTFNRKRNNLAKHFEPVNKKNIFNGKVVFKNITVITLLIAIFTSLLYVLPIVSYKKYLDEYIGVTNVSDRYHDYDKHNITFAENEKYYVIENDIYSIKVPEKLSINSDTELSTNYKDSNSTLSILMYKEFIDVEEIIDKSYQNTEMPINLNIKQEIKDRYGFFPKSDYENNKLMRMIYNDNVSVLDRRLTIATYYFRVSDSLILNDDKIYLYEDEEKTLSVQTSSYNRDDGKTTYFYTVSGNAIGDYDKFFHFTILTVCENEEEDFAYKIINSIEFK